MLSLTQTNDCENSKQQRNCFVLGQCRLTGAISILEFSHFYNDRSKQIMT